MNIEIDKLIIKVKLTDGKMKAIVALDFGDFVVRGFRVLDSQYENKRGEKLWVVPPSYQSGNKFRPMAFFPDKAIWAEIEERILVAYQDAVKNRYKKTFDLSEEEVKEYIAPTA